MNIILTLIEQWTKILQTQVNDDIIGIELTVLLGKICTILIITFLATGKWRR